MFDVLVVSFDNSKQMAFLSPNELSFSVGDKVVVSTENGFQLATVKKNVYKEKKDNLLAFLYNTMGSHQIFRQNILLRYIP